MSLFGTLWRIQAEARWLHKLREEFYKDLLDNFSAVNIVRPANTQFLSDSSLVFSVEAEFGGACAFMKPYRPCSIEQRIQDSCYSTKQR